MAIRTSEIRSSSTAISSSTADEMQATIDLLTERLPEPVNQYDDITAPNLLVSGKRFVVLNDSDETLNGVYIAAGSNIGEAAKTLIPS